MGRVVRAANTAATPRAKGRKVNDEKTANSTANKNNPTGELSHSVWPFIVCGDRVYFPSPGAQAITAA